MKVLVVSQYFWPESFRINELVTSLRKKGVEVEVLTGKPNYPDGFVFDGYSAWGCDQEYFGEVIVSRVPLLPRGKGPFRLGLNYLSFIVTASVLGPWILRKRRFDLIFVYGLSPIFQAIPAILLGWLKNCPVVLWIQDLWPDSLAVTGYITNPYLLRVLERIVGIIYQNVNLILVQSGAFISKVNPLAGRTRIMYYPNSFLEDKPEVKFQNLASIYLDCDFPVMFTGNIGTAQNVEVILEAATILKDVKSIRFVMVGDGSRRNWLQQQVLERDLNNLVFSGSFPVKEMPNLMASAAVLLVTLADTEIFNLTIPSKIQAYLSSGRPIVACLNGAGAEIVKEADAGLIVPAGNAKALAQAVMRLYEMPEQERLEMGMRGRKYFDLNFSHEKLVDKLIICIEQIIHQKK